MVDRGKILRQGRTKNAVKIKSIFRRQFLYKLAILVRIKVWRRSAGLAVKLCRNLCYLCCRLLNICQNHPASVFRQISVKCFEPLSKLSKNSAKRRYREILEVFI